ncbi:hypothetical protein [Neptuniibacter sp.]|uniref:hypothetical protein n=1 Tax=Neptuniibacter sp. TaxID=1962643 RepID=UPI00260500BE|nr:hypothetical protein [Neptuniibacter sp.]MCP4597285.1 hypothetical protein [Neptuniibacter sp.]
MEFVVVFLISFFVLIGVALAFAFGKTPAYRPSRTDILQLLGDVINKNASVERWELFLSLPISNDPALENIRQRCLVIAFGDDQTPAAGEGINGAILDKRGQARLREVMMSLETLIAEEPGSKWF